MVQYDHNNPSSVRQFGLIIRAVLEEKDLLESVVSPEQSFDEWLRASDFSKKDKESLEAYAESKEHRILQRKKAFMVMIQWPGVLSQRIIDREMASSPRFRACAVPPSSPS